MLQKQMRCQIKAESLLFPTMYKSQKFTFPTCSGFCGSGSPKYWSINGPKCQSSISQFNSLPTGSRISANNQKYTQLVEVPRWLSYYFSRNTNTGWRGQTELYNKNTTSFLKHHASYYQIHCHYVQHPHRLSRYNHLQRTKKCYTRHQNVYKTMWNFRIS